MPIDYKIRNLRRLFGESSFLKPSQSDAAPNGWGKVGRYLRPQESADGKETARRTRRTRGSGGVPRAFFSQEPPRSIRSKPVGGQLNVIHLFEKQKMKLYYGCIRDGKFKKYVDEAKSKRFNTDAVLLRLLELRLDTFLYRTGFPITPAQARQWIHHNRILINGQVVNIKSFRMKPGDEMTIKDRHMENVMKVAKESANMRRSFGCGASWIVSRPDPVGMLPWMEIDRTGLAAVLVREPTDDEARLMARAALFPFVRDANMNPHAAMRAYR